MSHPDPTKEYRPCEHPDCNDAVVDDDYCETHLEYYFCECGQRLEDAAGSPGDGLCRKCD
jgi:hypothetical protein